MSDDNRQIAAQIGRPLRAASTVTARCNLGLPVVITVPPVLDSGEPFPTRFWLTCPLAHKRIARLEAAGAVKTYEQRILDDPKFAASVEAAHADYAESRDAHVTEDIKIKPRGGVGGAARGVKCLHAHFAHFVGGGDNLIGQETAEAIGALHCHVPCVVLGDDSSSDRRNPDWSEPRR